MSILNRRNFLKKGAIGAAGMAMLPAATGFSPFIHTKGDLLFRPYPHPLMPPVENAYVSDVNGDPIYDSVLNVTQAGVNVPANDAPFAVNARWYVEGFGYLFLEADNGGRFYTSDDFTAGTRSLNLNRAFAESRMAHNERLLERYEAGGTHFSTEVTGLHAMAQQILEDAQKTDGGPAGALANRSLLHALWAGEKIELEKARSDIAGQRLRRNVHFGCDTRQYVWAKTIDYVDRFVEAFDFATITHYLHHPWYEPFEPARGEHRWGIKDNIAEWCLHHDITIEGRPLVWFHPVVSPNWLREMNVAELKRFVEQHTEALVSHYGDKVQTWEVINEYHDWANLHHHSKEQITDIARLAMEKTREINPRVSRLVNNCCPFADYVGHGITATGEATRPLRSPHQFVSDLVQAEVPFEIIGVQMYFPGRDLSSIVKCVERFAKFGKPVYISEIGVSSGKDMDHPALYDWHRPWDEELQADWLEQLYTIFYSKPYVRALNWYDFADARPYIPDGGLVKADGTPKSAYRRLQKLLSEWNQLPEEATTEGPADRRAAWEP